MSDFVKKIILLTNDYSTFKFEERKKIQKCTGYTDNIILSFIQNIYVRNNYKYIIYMEIYYILTIKIYLY